MTGYKSPRDTINTVKGTETQSLKIKTFSKKKGKNKMTNNVRINHKDNTIIVANKAAKKAEIYGTEEYALLQKARRDYPEFSVVIEDRKNFKRDTMKGLTYDFMRTYIEKHDPDGDIMNEYLMLLGESEIAKELGAEAVSYGEMKSWFLSKFDEIKRFYDTRDRVLGKSVA